MSKEQVMDYVMNSPANTNPNVLSGMLDGISGTQLPSPTKSDNGKVLGVSNGEYKLVEKSKATEFDFVELFTYSLTTDQDGVGKITGSFKGSKALKDLVTGRLIINLFKAPSPVSNGSFTSGETPYSFAVYTGDIRIGTDLMLNQFSTAVKNSTTWAMEVLGKPSTSYKGTVYAVVATN